MNYSKPIASTFLNDTVRQAKKLTNTQFTIRNEISIQPGYIM